MEPGEFQFVPCRIGQDFGFGVAGLIAKSGELFCRRPRRPAGGSFTDDISNQTAPLCDLESALTSDGCYEGGVRRLNRPVPGDMRGVTADCGQGFGFGAPRGNQKHYDTTEQKECWRGTINAC